MPIEIKELHIRVAVESKPEPPPRARAPAAAQGGSDAIVAECVEEVMRILQARRER